MDQPPDLSTVPRRVAFLRSLTGLSASAFGRLVGLSTAAIGMIEGGADDAGVRDKTAGKIAQATGTTAEWISFNVGKPPTAAKVKRTAEAAAREMGMTIAPAGSLVRVAS